MFSLQAEVIFYELFLYKCIFRNHLNLKDIFQRLKSMFCIKENIDDYLEVVFSEVVEDIATEEDYKRYLRIQQYNRFMGLPNLCSAIEEAMISLKGEAIITATQYKLFARESLPGSLIERNLIHYAKAGNIVAMRILGFIECEGMFVKKNVEHGIQLLSKASLWGDFVATLSLLKHDLKHQKKYLAQFSGIVKDTIYKDYPNIVESFYDIKSEEEAVELKLLRKAFSNGKAKQDFYDPMISRILYSHIIKSKDKEKVLFAENKELISEACDLPLKLEYEDINFGKNLLQQIPIARLNEQKAFFQALLNNDLRNTNLYHPICLWSESEYALHFYEQILLQKMGNFCIEKIEVSDLKEYDFELSKNHVFLRNIDEDKTNIYLLNFKGDIPEEIMNKVSDFLVTEKRRKFHLLQPSITLDLSCILPICLCDKQNYNKVKTLVEGIKIAEISELEKPIVINELLQEKRHTYHITEARIEDQALQRLGLFSLDRIDKILDHAIKENRKKNQDLMITEDMLEPFLKEKKHSTGKSAYGFGGTINENNQ